MARKAKTKPISFKEEFYEEYDHINKIKNASEYVCKLIREDRKRSEEDVELLAQQAEALLIRVEALKQKNKTN